MTIHNLLTMGFLDKKLNEGKLDSLSFLNCLRWLRDESERISYSRGSNDEYWKAKELIEYLIKRYCREFNLTSENFMSTEIGGLMASAQFDLKDYHRYGKADTIAEFKLDMRECTDRLIYDIENS